MEHTETTEKVAGHEGTSPISQEHHNASQPGPKSDGSPEISAFMAYKVKPAPNFHQVLL
jgi:hypothetical protein